MSVVRFLRASRTEVPRTPGGEVELQPPPAIPRIIPGSLLSKMLPFVMIIAMVGMVALMFTSGMAANPMSLLFPAMMMVSMLGMLAGGGKGNGPRAAEANEDRKDYLRYLDHVRDEVRDTSRLQRRALDWSHPDPDLLWSLVGTTRMWERTRHDPDFCHVRVGRGDQRLATRLVPPETGPVEELEPVSAVSLRRFVRAHSVVREAPTSLSLRGFAAISVDGDRESARCMVRSMLASLCVFHGPDQLMVAIVCGPDTERVWEWVKWLPHNQHPAARDGAGTSRLVFRSFLDLQSALSLQLGTRNRFSRNAPVAEGVPQLVIVVDGGLLDHTGGEITEAGLDSVTILDLSGYCPRLAKTKGLQLVQDGGRTGARSGPRVEIFATSDVLSVADADTVARRLSPYRTASQLTDDDTGSAGAELNAWNHLLGIADIGLFDADRSWVVRRGRDRLRVPIGLGADGRPVEIDLKESAENGMGPHGLCIGATGSGKSEFLRTLVLGLLVTHSPEQLNLVLVDFKGGATFSGLEDAPHVAAVITNLSEDLTMVDRMRDALAGEMNRRQELLRSAGNYANVGDYEKARSAGASLAPLPALFIVVDEFSELLSQQPEFADLFVAIGRLGRSLHMHLLLASQRLEEGKLRGLDSHLSYRIGLKTFSANESRTVLGVPDAYHLPAQPGVGYLKSDSAEILRFAASYVSGPYTGGRRRPRIAGPALESNLVPRRFTAAAVPLRPEDTMIATYEDVPALPQGETHTVLDTVIDRIRGHGHRAHEVWLPPLGASPTLDQLIPHPPDARLLARSPAALRAPIGVIDRPYDQLREDLAIDLAGGRGHVAIVGGPQSGKSTALRTLILSMALTHTSEQIQFYLLDFGGGALAGLADLPHVGSVANRLDVDRVRRTVAEMTSLVAQREQHFRRQGIHSMVDFRRRRSGSLEPGVVDADSFGDVFLVIDGWATIRSDYEPLEAAIAALVSQGLSYGLHLILTASRWAEIRPATKDLVGTRIELRLGDPSDSDVGRAKATLVPDNWPGRGITRDGLHFLTALPRIDGSADGADLTAGVAHVVAAVSERTVTKPAPPVRMLPEKYLRTAMLTVLAGRWPLIDQHGTDERGVRRVADRTVPIGVDEAELAPVFLDFADQAHLLIFGDSACGKTTLLSGLCDSLMRADTPRHTKIILADYRRTMLGVVETDHLAGYAASQKTLTTMMNDLVVVLAERMPGPTITQQQLRERSWWTGPDIYVIVDDYDLIATPNGNPLLVLVDYLAHARDIGFHLLLARRSGGAARAMYDPVISRLKDLVSAGIVMSGSRDEGNLIGTVRPSDMPPGRGTLVTRHNRALVQLASSPRP